LHPFDKLRTGGVASRSMRVHRQTSAGAQL